MLLFQLSIVCIALLSGGISATLDDHFTVTELKDFLPARIAINPNDKDFLVAGSVSKDVQGKEKYKDKYADAIFGRMKAGGELGDITLLGKPVSGHRSRDTIDTQLVSVQHLEQTTL